MIHIATCNNFSCEKKTECYRHMAENYYDLNLLDFKAVCNVSNNFKWFYEIGDKPIRKIEIERTVN